MNRYFLSSEEFEQKVLQNDNFYHLSKVMRATKNLFIEVVYNTNLYLAKIELVTKDLIRFVIVEKIKQNTEPPFYTNFYLGLSKKNNFEFCIEKLVELGVMEITPVIMERSVVHIKKLDYKKKIQRWKKIILKASRQAKRLIIPKINEIMLLKSIKNNKSDVNLVAYEHSGEFNSLKIVLKELKPEQKLNVLIGPEGGISDNELFLLKKQNFKEISLGKRTLRSETSPIFIINSLIYEREL